MNLVFCTVAVLVPQTGVIFKNSFLAFLFGLILFARLPWVRRKKIQAASFTGSRDTAKNVIIAFLDFRSLTWQPEYYNVLEGKRPSLTSELDRQPSWRSSLTNMMAFVQNRFSSRSACPVNMLFTLYSFDQEVQFIYLLFDQEIAVSSTCFYPCARWSRSACFCMFLQGFIQTPTNHTFSESAWSGEFKNTHISALRVETKNFTFALALSFSQGGTQCKLHFPSP